MLQQHLHEAVIDLVKVTKREHTPEAGLYARLLFLHIALEDQIVDTTVENSNFRSTTMKCEAFKVFNC